MAKGKYEYWKSDDGLLLLRAYARDALTDEQIAQKCGIATGTLYGWKKQYHEIDEALKRGKEPVDIEVENALFKKATGYSYEEVKVEYEYESNEPTKRTVTKKFVSPDVAAMIFWLKNRKPEKWRDKQEITDTTALDKLDEILKDIRNNAESDKGGKDDGNK